jgi:hypothetical protein
MAGEVVMDMKLMLAEVKAEVKVLLRGQMPLPAPVVTEVTHG